MVRSETDAPAVVGVGIATPIGLSARSCFAALRAGVIAFSETPHISGSGEAIRTSCLVGLPPNTARADRMRLLGRLALADLVRNFERRPLGRLGFFIGMPEERTEDDGQALDFAERLAALVASAFDIPCPAARVYNVGRSSFFFALERAVAALGSGDCDAAIVGGVDSLCAPDTLRQFDTDRRLLGSVSSDGIIPGEGAAFVMLTTIRAAELTFGNIVCVSTGREPQHFNSDGTNTASALSIALQAIRTHPKVAGCRADLLFTCETGERFWADEVAMAYFRNVALMPEPFVRTTAGEAFGDLGAAAGAVQFAMGLEALAHEQRVRTEPALLLVCGSSDAGHLGGCLVQGYMGFVVDGQLE